MISRRNIRVKVMQTLYALSAQEDERDNVKTRHRLLEDKLHRSMELFTVSILYVLRTAQYAEQDAAQRRGKWMPTSEDLMVNTKIAGNEFLWSVLENESFKAAVEQGSLENYVQEDWVRKLYQELVKTPEYAAYIALESRDKTSEKNILRFIWEQLILANEKVQELFTEELPGWEDDQMMIQMLMDNYFKQPKKVNFLNLLSAEKRQYAYELLDTCLEKEAQLQQLISPRLANWDAERVALIDLILLRMGVCELLYFPTIPTKVTINEYIDIAKDYSTEQSGHFVNGVLDNVLKDLVRNNQINKQERFKK